MNYLLIITVFLPLAGALLLWVLSPLGRNIVRWSALGAAIAVFVLAGAVLCGAGETAPTSGIPAEFANTITDVPWFSLGNLDIRFSLGLDGFGFWLFGLTTLLIITSVLVSWEAISDRPGLFYGMLLLLEFGCLGVFAARDVLLFYIFFEFTLIPLFFLIGIWGSEQRLYAAAKFFIFTLAGSVLTFLGLLGVAVLHAQYSGAERVTFSIIELSHSLSAQPDLIPLSLQRILFIALFIGFAIKVPLFPLHTWLPLAHVQAPTAGSVLLAGILLKIGTFGFLRFSIPMLPAAAAYFMPALLWLAVAGIIYGALVALAQSDMKKLIAYSSVSHLGYVMLGMFAFTLQGVQGGALQMINHGISTGGLFAVVGMLYERYHTRQIKDLGGLARRVPIIAFFMLVFTFSSIGLPGLNGFAGEFLVLLGMFQRALGDYSTAGGQLLAISVLSIAGVVLGAWYMLYLVQRVFFGPLKEPHHEADAEPVKDMSVREILALAPLAILALVIGLFPQPFLERMNPSSEAIVNTMESPLAEQAAVAAHVSPKRQRGVFEESVSATSFAGASGFDSQNVRKSVNDQEVSRAR